MDWITPKTNWTANDIFSLQDWQRITNNFEYMYSAYGCDFQLNGSVFKTSSSATLTYEDVSLLEEMLFDLYLSATFVLSEYELTVWYARLSEDYVGNPSYVDFNRWEGLELELKDCYELLRAQQNTLFSGTFASGNDSDRQGVRV